MLADHVDNVSASRPVRGAWSSLAGLVLAVGTAWGQITTGSISGNVTDPAGAIVVGATVKVTNQATGVSSALLTNEAGVFKAAFLAPGAYTVSIQAPGFSTFEAKDVVVELAHEPVINATLQIGAVGDTVTV